MVTTSPHRRLWPRFTLRLLLISVTAVGLGLGYWTHRVRQQHIIVERMKRVGIDYHYDFELREGTNRSSVPRWLLSGLDVDFFHRVEAIRMGEFDTNRAESVAILRDLSRLGGLQRVSIESKEITDGEAAILEDCRQLRTLTILCHEHHGMGRSMHTPPLTDSTLEMIARLPQIRQVRIEGLHFTPTGLRSLAKSLTLEVLCVHHCENDVTRNDLQTLRDMKCLKHLNVTRYRYGEPGFDQIVNWGEPPW